MSDPRLGRYNEFQVPALVYNMTFFLVSSNAAIFSLEGMIVTRCQLDVQAFYRWIRVRECHLPSLQKPPLAPNDAQQLL